MIHTPPQVAEEIKDIIQDKVVCDVGCNDGSFMESLAKYASKVIGVESDVNLAQMAAQKGFDVYHEDSFFNPLPEADVYYLWTRDMQGVYLKAKMEKTKGIFVFGHSVRLSTIAFLKSLNAEEREVGGFKIHIKYA